MDQQPGLRGLSTTVMEDCFIDTRERTISNIVRVEEYYNKMKWGVDYVSSHVELYSPC